MALSTEYILSSLSNLYGDEVVAADVRAWCAMNATTYQTVTKKLDAFKVVAWQVEPDCEKKT